VANFFIFLTFLRVRADLRPDFFYSTCFLMFLFRIAPAFCSGRIFAQYVFCILNLPPIKKFLGLSSPVQSDFNFFKGMSAFFIYSTK